jgi:glycosyltransferase involved in cell wall biosynthesis
LTSFFVFIERIEAKITSKISVLTEKGLGDHIDKKIGTESLFTIIPSGVDIQRFSDGDSSGVLAETGWKDKKIVGWAGRLVPIKDCFTFIQAAALIRRRCPDARFIVAGDGEEREMLKGRAREAGLNDYLVFLGDRTDIPSVMAAMDVFVLSSLNEGFGRVLVEAMAAGVVVISSAVGGTVDVIEDGESGILVPPSEPSRIADAVSKVLENSELKSHLIDGGRERAKQFDIHITAEKFEDLYEKLLGL